MLLHAHKWIGIVLLNTFAHKESIMNQRGTAYLSVSLGMQIHTLVIYQKTNL
jgi:hypothetical protein